MSVINAVVGLGAPVMMPILFLVMGLVFGLGFGKSFKAGMLVGIGFVGVSLVINYLLDALGSATQANWVGVSACSGRGRHPARGERFTSCRRSHQDD